MIRKYHNHKLQTNPRTVSKSYMTFTVTRHSKDNKDKATSSHFLIKMIAKLERTKRNAYQNKDQHRILTQKWEVHTRISQQQQNHRLRTGSSLSYRGHECILMAPNLRFVVNTQKLLSLHGGFVTNAMHHHREKNLIK